LLVSLRTAPVVKADHVGQRHTAIEDLTADENTKRTPELELPRVIEEGRDIILRIDLGNGDVAGGQRFDHRVDHLRQFGDGQAVELE
jgi:hypothetical protein